MKMIQRIVLAALATLILGVPLYAANDPVRCIVILKGRSAAAPDVASLGGRIESRQDEQLVVTIPAEAVGRLEADPAVLYIERVGGGEKRDERTLVGVPAEPGPGPSAAKRRLTPQPLGNTTRDLGVYSYDGAGNIFAIGNDGYVYDGAQRLVQSSTMGVSESYTYDGFGNMKTRTNRTIPIPDGATNHYQGYSYNEIGAVTSDGAYTFSYDAVGQPVKKDYTGCSTCTEYYVYTANDERIGTEHGFTSSTPGWWYWSLRDEGGKVLRQYRSSTGTPGGPLLWLEDFVWRDGLLLGSNRPVEMGGRRHYHLDHLGTPRLITSDNSAQLVSDHHYYPFGDEESPVVQETAGGFDREDPLKFTGHERDFAAGPGAPDSHYVDYMHARYFAPVQGRFLSPDPVLDIKASLKNPQGWNRYAYVLNNPMRFTDPTGRYVCRGDGAACKTIEGGLQKMRESEAELKESDPKRAAELQKVIDAYGKAGDATTKIKTVWVNPADAKGNPLLPGNVMGRAGKEGQMAVSLINIAAKARGDSKTAFLILGGTMTHEGDHELQPGVVGLVGKPSLLSLIFYETHAYSLEGAYYRGLGQGGMAPDPKQGAWGSAMEACRQVGCTP